MVQREAPTTNGLDYRIVEFADMTKLWAVCDVAICRAGASTLAELTTLSIPSIIVPLPGMSDHQTKNALVVVEAGGATLVLDRECTGAKLEGSLETMMEPRPLRPWHSARARSDERTPPRPSRWSWARSEDGRERCAVTLECTSWVSGGAGMSGVARLLVERGARVSGSDAQDSSALEGLRALGVDVYVGHDAHHGADADVVLWSPAIATDNPELAAARARGALMMNRAALFGELATEQRVLGLTGTHGKTTATSMLVQVLFASGRDDGRLLGVEVLGVGANGHFGSDDLVVELDESYGTFAEVAPYALGLLNVEPDHLDHYGSLDALEEAFAALVERTSGPVVVWSDDGARAGSPSAPSVRSSTWAPPTTRRGTSGMWRCGATPVPSPCVARASTFS